MTKEDLEGIRRRSMDSGSPGYGRAARLDIAHLLMEVDRLNGMKTITIELTETEAAKLADLLYNEAYRDGDMDRVHEKLREKL